MIFTESQKQEALDTIQNYEQDALEAKILDQEFTDFDPIEEPQKQELYPADILPEEDRRNRLTKEIQYIQKLKEAEAKARKGSEQASTESDALTLGRHADVFRAKRIVRYFYARALCSSPAQIKRLEINANDEEAPTTEHEQELSEFEQELSMQPEPDSWRKAFEYEVLSEHYKRKGRDSYAIAACNALGIDKGKRATFRSKKNKTKRYKAFLEKFKDGAEAQAIINKYTLRNEETA